MLELLDFAFKKLKLVMAFFLQNFNLEIPIIFSPCKSGLVTDGHALLVDCSIAAKSLLSRKHYEYRKK